MDAKQLILNASRITVVGHTSPDGDVIGSTLGLAFALEKAGKQCTLVSPDPVPASFAFLPGVDRIAHGPVDLEHADLIIVLDASDTKRLGAVYENNLPLFHAVPVLNIDHHVTNCFSATVVMKDPAAAAAAEQVALLLEEMEFPLDPIVATCLMTGLVSDTQCFRTPSTSARSLAVAARLLQAGAPLAQIVNWLYNTHPLPKLVLWGKVLSGIRLADKIVWGHVDLAMLEESRATSEETDGLIDLLAGVRSAEVAAIFKETPGQMVKVSLRSTGSMDVARLASHFGGGGHVKAAGFSLPGLLPEAETRVLDFLSRTLAEN